MPVSIFVTKKYEIQQVLSRAKSQKMLELYELKW